LAENIEKAYPVGNTPIETYGTLSATAEYSDKSAYIPPARSESLLMTSSLSASLHLRIASSE
jgi:hypothetical protein